jgi:hypothetical protein
MVDKIDDIIATNTSKGYIGWAFPQVLRGDQIFIPNGCSVPVILRSREEGGYYLLGDTYVGVS